MKLFLIWILTLSFSVQASAVTGEFTCPETHPVYSKVLSELESFKETLRENLDCQEVAVNFDKITELLSSESRAGLLSLVGQSGGKPLSAESATKIQSFASSITEEIAVALSLIGTQGGLMSLFAGTNKCNLDEEDEFQAIERLTKAAYVATGLVSKVSGPYGVPLQIGASAFYGVVQGLQSYSERKRHIDFDDFAKREFFEGAVCLMSKFDSDIRKLNNPESHLRRLKNARSEAQRVVSAIQYSTDVAVVEERKKVSRENLAWIENEIVKYSSITEFKSGGIGPSELQSLKNTINKFLLNTAAPEFIEWYSKKAQLSTRAVVSKTASTLSSLRQNLRDSDKKMDMKLPISTEKSLSTELYPYVSRQNYVLEAPAVSNLYFISKNLEDVSDRAYEFYSLLGEAYDLWKLSDLNVRVVQEYCEFFQNTRKYSGPLSDACEERSLVSHSLRVAHQAFYLAHLINDNKELDVLGPFDFRLEKHMLYTKLYTDLRGKPFRLAEQGLDFDAVLDLDKNIRVQDGRLKAANDNSPSGQSGTVGWWFDVETYADEFIEQTQILGSNL